MSKRAQNETRFGNWQNASDGSRLYWYDVPSRHGGLARYFKAVDADENTIRFWQEIYDQEGRIIGVHEKFPLDKGHRRF